MKLLLTIIIAFLTACSEQPIDLNTSCEQVLMMKNQLLLEQITQFCRLQKINKNNTIVTVSIQSIENANEFVISSTINAPNSLSRYISFEVIDGYIVAYYMNNINVLDNTIVVSNLLNKIRKMGIIMHKDFVIYESKMCIIKMNFDNTKIITKECI